MMKNYIDELVRERENDTKTVQNIMLSVSPYYQKRILNDALQAYAMYINKEIENNKEVMTQLSTAKRG